MTRFALAVLALSLAACTDPAPDPPIPAASGASALPAGPRHVELHETENGYE